METSRPPYLKDRASYTSSKTVTELAKALQFVCPWSPDKVASYLKKLQHWRWVLKASYLGDVLPTVQLARDMHRLSLLPRLLFVTAHAQDFQRNLWNCILLYSGFTESCKKTVTRCLRMRAVIATVIIVVWCGDWRVMDINGHQHANSSNSSSSSCCINVRAGVQASVIAANVSFKFSL